jgi:hypothetical protein
MIGAFEGILAAFWVGSLALMRWYFIYRLDGVEAKLSMEIAREADALQGSIEDSIQDLHQAFGKVADMDPLDAIQVQIAGMKASLMQTVLEMGVGWIGQKFSKNLGVFESLAPDTQSDAEPALLDEMPAD